MESVLSKCDHKGCPVIVTPYTSYTDDNGDTVIVSHTSCGCCGSDLGDITTTVPKGKEDK